MSNRVTFGSSNRQVLELLLNDSEAHTVALTALAVSVANLTALIKQVLTLEGTIMADTSNLGVEIADLTTKVEADTTVIGSASILIAGFAKQLADAIAAALAQGVTPGQLASLTALGAQIDANDSTLAAAIAANTAAQNTSV